MPLKGKSVSSKIKELYQDNLNTGVAKADKPYDKLKSNSKEMKKYRSPMHNFYA